MSDEFFTFSLSKQIVCISWCNLFFFAVIHMISGVWCGWRYIFAIFMHFLSDSIFTIDSITLAFFANFFLPFDLPNDNLCEFVRLFNATCCQRNYSYSKIWKCWKSDIELLCEYHYLHQYQHDFSIWYSERVWVAQTIRTNGI